MGWSVSLSSVADPPGPLNVMLAKLPAQSGATGKAKAKPRESPAASAT